MFIRDCELQDIEKWVELNLEFMKYEIKDEEFWSHTSNVKEDNLRNIFAQSLLNKEHIKLMFIEKDNTIIGFMNLLNIFSVWGGGRALVLDDLYIIEKYRGFGVGKGVMDFLEAYAEKNGYKRIQFLSEFSNEKAYSFYTKLGYPSQNMHFHMKYI